MIKWPSWNRLRAEGSRRVGSELKNIVYGKKRTMGITRRQRFQMVIGLDLTAAPDNIYECEIISCMLS